MKAVIVALAFALVSGICFADIAPPSFTCPSGQVEDLQCAATCCEENGGTYSFGEESCTVDTSAQWNAAMQCEQRENCCKSAGSNGNSSSGCCAAFVLLAGAGMLGFAVRKA